MLYRFIKKDGNVERIGDIDAETLESKLQGYLNDGFELASAEEHDQQVIGAVNRQLETANEKIVELEGKLEEKGEAA
ncbi:MAG: hypothetical protein ABIO72_05930 [Patescibacteria group bacterium]